MVGTSPARNRQRLSQRSCQKGKELTLPRMASLNPLTFTRAIPSEVPSTPVNFRSFRPISHHFPHGHFDHRKMVFQCTY